MRLNARLRAQIRAERNRAARDRAGVKQVEFCPACGRARDQSKQISTSARCQCKEKKN